MSTHRNLPTKKAIKTHWAEWLITLGKFDSIEELFEADYCWGCGMEERTERCHIQAKVNGGTDTVKNLHLLCKDCHKDSEFLEDLDYFKWIEARNLMSRSFGNADGKTILDFINNYAKGN